MKNDRTTSASRRKFLSTSLVAGAGLAVLPSIAEAHIHSSMAHTSALVPDFELDEATFYDLQKGMESGKFTARSITEKYLARIEAVDKNGPKLNAIIELNPDAIAIADALDKERKAGKVRDPLHGIPILIKDNLDTADKMMTTAGSLALMGSKPFKDSTVAAKLRAAGAVILGKTNLSEWANIRSGHSTSGWSGRGGLTKNPYALDRNPCGSSSGSGAAVSANLCAAAIGTETDGSIVCPSSANGIVGIKPTVGLTSRAGIIPISHSQDGAGPMARTVRDAVILLGAMTGVDADDAATAASRGNSFTDYSPFLDVNGLKGARIGVARKYFGFSEPIDAMMETALEAMRKAGAVLVDPADIETHGKFDDSELTVLLYELKADLNSYLAKLGPNAPVKSLKEVIAFNEKHHEREMPYFGQDFFLKAVQKGPLTDKEYLDAVENNLQMSRIKGTDALMEKHKLDAIIAPTAGTTCLTDLLNGDHFTGGSSNAAAVAGYPNINVIGGYLHGMPVGMSIWGRAWSEPKLIRIAYSFEQTMKIRQSPKFLPTMPLDPRG